jgi:RHS repeat-associated protein
MEKLNKSACKNIILLLVIFLFGTICSAQSPLQMYTTPGLPYVELGINTDVPPAEDIYKGRDGVTLLPGTLIKNDSKVYLDPSIQAPVTYSSNTNSGFETTLPELDKDLDVGTIPGQASVNLMGGASYTIPFDFPKGSGGVAPQISLTYNSGGGMGIAGLGWNLNGLFAITRGGRNFADDGFIRPVSLTNGDYFMLNGARLFPDGGNGLDGTFYHTQNESFSTIISHANNNYDGPIWWEIITKEGVKIEIGNNLNSKLNHEFGYNNNGFNWLYPNILWMVNKITDPNGNYMTFQYDNKNNTEIILTKIIYSGNDEVSPGIIPDCEINFYYSLSSFPNQINLAGKKAKNTVLLRKIESKVSNEIYNTYSFEYTKENVWEFLVNVQKSNRYGDKLNPTWFSYENDILSDNLNNLFYKSSSTSGNSISFPTLANRNIFFADFNADGNKDMILVEGVNVNNNTLNKYTILKNNGSGVYENIQEISTPMPSYFNTEFITENIKNGREVCSFIEQITDVNGDGYEDILVTNEISRTSQWTGECTQLLISNGNGYNLNWITPTPSQVANGMYTQDFDRSIVNHKYMVLDLNGNSESEVVKLTSSVGIDPKLEIKVYDKSSNYLLNQNLQYTQNGSHSLHMISINRIENTNQEIITGIAKLSFPVNLDFYYLNLQNNIINLNPTGSNPLVINPDCSSPDFYNLRGDFNGDGYLDNLSFNNPIVQLNGETINLLPYGVSVGVPVLYVANVLDCSNQQFVADVNGDGKSDLIQIVPYNGNSLVKLYYCTGVKFIDGGEFEITASTDKIKLHDANGDGVLDLIFPSESQSNNIFVHYFNRSIPHMQLSKVKDGLGKLNVFEYKLTNELVKLVNQNQLIFPNNIIGLSGNLVYQLRTSNGIGGYFISEYGYENPIINREGKGFLGYQKNIIKDRTNNLMQVNSNHLFVGSINANGSLSNYSILLLKNSESFKIDNTGNLVGGAITKTESFYDITPLLVYTENCPNLPSLSTTSYTNRRTSIVKKQTIDEYNYLANTHNHTTISTDNDGNVYNTTTDYNGIETTTTNITFDPNEKYTVPFLPSTLTKTTTRGNNSLENVINYSYDNRRVDIETHLDMNANNATNYEYNINYDYYPSGSLLKSTLTNSEGSTHNEYFYDTKNKSLVSEKNTLGQSTNYTYDPIFSSLSSRKSITSLNSYYEYNGWLREIKQTSPTGINFENKLEWADPNEIVGKYPSSISNFEDRVVYKVIKSTSGLPSTLSYFDVLGREIFSTSEGFNELMYSINNYNSKGQLFQAYEPYTLTGMNKRYVEKNYDDLGRLATCALKSLPSATTVTTAYTYSFTNGNLTVSENKVEEGITTSTTTDVTGRTIESMDASNGKVQYAFIIEQNNQYRIETTVINQITTKAYFDEAGNQKELWDKQAGSTLYEYYGNGKLMKQTDPNGNIYNFHYSPEGRLETKIGSEGTYTYSYETGNNGMNKIKQIDGPNGLIKYVYDNFQNLTKEEEIYGIDSYITLHEYDAYGRETKYTYPNNILTTQNVYDAKGFLVKIEDLTNSKTIWQLDEMTNANQIKKYTLGNGKTTTYTYTNERLLNTVQHTNVEQLLDYNFNPLNGNLDYRKRQLSGSNIFEEDFVYDDLSRLKDITTAHNSVVGITSSTSFDSRGRIQVRTDAGTDYSYNGSNRLLNIEHPTPNLPSNEQLISYNSFKSPSIIKEFIGQVPTNGDPQEYYELTYTYGPNQQRIKGEWKHFNGTNINGYRTRKYANNYEVNEEGNIVYSICYISSPTGLCAMYVKENSQLGQMKYVYTDHLGSITAVTSESGSIIARMNFDAWGRRRNAQDYSYISANTIEIHNGLISNTNLPAWLYRGYTGHEMLNEFGLINMNARLYDPVVGMMLSCDNYVTDASNTQCYNRYNYCYNNPLKYTDPDGNWAGWDDVIAMGIGGAINVAMHWNQISTSSTPWKDGLVAFGIGALAGEAALLTGGATLSLAGGTGFLAGAAAAGVGYTYSAPLQASMNTAYFGDPVMTGKQFLIGLGTSMAVGGIISGSVAAYNGNNFWSGKSKVVITNSAPDDIVNSIDGDGLPGRYQEGFDEFSPRVEKLEDFAVSSSLEDRSINLKVTNIDGQIETMNIQVNYNVSNSTHADCTVINKSPDEVFHFISQGKHVDYGNGLYYKDGIGSVHYYQISKTDKKPVIQFSTETVNWLKLRFK